MARIKSPIFFYRYQNALKIVCNPNTGKKAQVLKRPPHNVSALSPIGHVRLLSAHLIYIFILPM
jgi:hypothetical protein